jgi:drug/metabolite transporter (DMT)-like permease
LRDRRSIALGLAIGLLGAGGQLLLFHAVRIGPPYLIFPIISLSPAVTIVLSFALLKERTGALGLLGILLALLALPLFDYRPDGESSGYGLWFLYAVAYVIFGLATTPLRFAAALLVYGTYYALTEGAQNALVAAFVPREHLGRAYGMYALVTGLLAIPASATFGWLFRYGDGRYAFLASAAIALVASLAMTRLVPPRESNAKRVPSEATSCVNVPPTKRPVTSPGLSTRSVSGASRPSGARMVSASCSVAAS